MLPNRTLVIVTQVQPPLEHQAACSCAQDAGRALSVH
jgi:hypothetical protein